jgi:hypothetical protein
MTPRSDQTALIMTLCVGEPGMYGGGYRSTVSLVVKNTKRSLYIPYFPYSPRHYWFPLLDNDVAKSPNLLNVC